jgi:uncharacterized protein (TIGR00369 family)
MESVPTFENGTALLEAFIPVSPFLRELGVVADVLEDDHVVLRLPWRPELATVGDLVHGGAIAALCDATVMAAAWAGAQLPENLRGVTVSLSIDFAAGARAEDVLAEGRIVRRGSSLSAVEVDLRAADGRRLGKAIGTYKVG